MEPESERHGLASLGDLMALVIEGWRIERMHYADRAAPSGPPAAYFDLERGPGEWQRVHIADDGRQLSHRAVVEMFRESPHIWKHRSADRLPAPSPPEAGEWAEISADFDHGGWLRPTGLRRVVAIDQTQCVDDVHIALTALEIYDQGARLRYLAHASGAVARRQMNILDVIVVDDAGRHYRVVPVDERCAGNRLDGELIIGPRPPGGVDRLTITIGTVASGDGDGLRALGPWVFPILLGGRWPTVD